VRVLRGRAQGARAGVTGPVVGRALTPVAEHA
jgi:hypothetical protein